MYINPYEKLDNAVWKKANFHTHAGTGPKTCGSHSAEETVGLYREYGYSLLCLSNHNLYRDYSNYSDEKMTLIDGVEYTSDIHMLTIGVRENLIHLPLQEAITKTKESGGFCILCHPNWPFKSTFSAEMMCALTGFMGMEVLNWVCFRLSGSGRATDIWDEMLTDGKLVTGFANDDFHAICDGGNYFNLIACENNYESMKQAIEANAICASSGLYPVYHRLDGDTLHVKATYPIGTYLENYVYTFIGPKGKILSQQTSASASYTLQGEDYVRVEVMGEGGHMILFQPVYREGTLIRP
ncbi:MAG: hypothetical protein E7480_08365 [Ruminococcaceae bacterium]|nr:hypothetical protein [Oscillospiraceae bacterium]